VRAQSARTHNGVTMLNKNGEVSSRLRNSCLRHSNLELRVGPLWVRSRHELENGELRNESYRGLLGWEPFSGESDRREVVTPARFERATPRLGIWCSILLSYGVCLVRQAVLSRSAAGEKSPRSRACAP
jgi:hypothetical protein